MAIVRLIYVKVQADQAGEAERLWKSQCAPLMIQQPGCQSEKLLRCIDSAGEYISYSEWDNQENVDRYLKSQAHQEIRNHSRSLEGWERPVVKSYEVG